LVKLQYPMTLPHMLIQRTSQPDVTALQETLWRGLMCWILCDISLDIRLPGSLGYTTLKHLQTICMLNHNKAINSTSCTP
jgi:hypothetical protein